LEPNQTLIKQQFQRFSFLQIAPAELNLCEIRSNEIPVGEERLKNCSGFTVASRVEIREIFASQKANLSRLRHKFDFIEGMLWTRSSMSMKNC
jgi:hypothetical protein